MDPGGFVMVDLVEKYGLSVSSIANAVCQLS